METAIIQFDFDAKTPALRIVVPSAYVRGELRRTFQDLAEARVTQVNLEKQPWINCGPAIKEFKLRLSAAEKEPSKVLTVIKTKNGELELDWFRHSEGWLECAELIDGLSGPGHQYFNYGHYEDVEIEVSFLE